MPQMVLPQTPAPGMKNDVSQGKASGPAQGSDRESRYESVSRAEQKRLDRQEADRRAAKAEESARQQEREPASEPTAKTAAAEGEQTKASKSETGDEQRPTTEAEASDKAAQTVADSEESLDAPVEVVPTTFAELQALLVPASTAGQGAGSAATAANGAGQTGVLPSVAAGAGKLNSGLTGKPGQGGQVAPGLTAGVQLTEALASTLGSEASRPAEPTSLIASGRFQSSLEVASQQVANAAATKLPAEAAVPLRSYATSIDTPVGQAEWGDKVMGKLSWLTARNMSVAEIHLTPPDMGPMEVKVRVQNEQANITVHAANPVVREQLEQQSHRLRDMLGEQGLNLSQFDVSDSPQQRSGEQESGEDQGTGGRGGSEESLLAEADEAEAHLGSLDLSWKGEVDIFA